MEQLFKRIDTVFLTVHNLNEAIEWYTGVLKFSLRWERGNYAALNIGETPLTLRQAETVDFEPLKEAFFNFYVSDIEFVYQHLLDNGVKVEEIQKEDDVNWFRFYDRDGNALEVCHFAE
ncbi:VOC family protein [Litchfieldia alkalitelluris]|uniref:VOC family protein n=1 Tax=Litchfieldia alkalitelluris TaxID=304268 RepID=UPI0009981B3B|nr:VOC family protein [Litchfieldia alkalitelluris]